MSLRMFSYCRLLVGKQGCKLVNVASFNQASQQWKSEGNKRKSKHSEKSKNSDQEKVSDEMKEAVKTVAKSIPGNEQKTEMELLSSLFKRSEMFSMPEGVESKVDDDEKDISNLLTKMKIDGNVLVSKGKVTEVYDERDITTSYKLFEGPDLGIFNPNAKEKVLYETTGEVYDEKQSLRHTLEREKWEATSIANIPTNGFQEMINWTKEGKLWNFPVNNEFGKEDSSVGFDEHIFLETQIKDFPRKGPIRHFMELVVVGLSKNPHISAKSKRNHINWFREYFKSKSKLLEESLGEASKFTERESRSDDKQKKLQEE